MTQTTVELKAPLLSITVTKQIQPHNIPLINNILDRTDLSEACKLNAISLLSTTSLDVAVMQADVYVTDGPTVVNQKW